MSNKIKNESCESDIITVFPSFVWRTQLNKNIYRKINKIIINKLIEMMEGNENFKKFGFWQSDQNIHHIIEFKEVISYVKSMAETIFEFLSIGYNDFFITGCWANINSPQTGHQIHSHPNNYLSGVYYVQVQDQANTINFHDPRLQTGIFRPPVTKLTNENTDQVVLKVKNGTLLLFPSWLQHSTGKNCSNSLRISLSFNIMFSDFSENLSQPLW